MTQISIQTNQVLDCKGMACPMPLVRTKKAVDQLQSGQVIEVQATDKGSIADMQAWCKNIGHQYIGNILEGNLIRHFVRKSNPTETKAETQFPHIVSNEQLQAKLASGTGTERIVLDVREPAEYAFNHIPGAVHIPLGALSEQASHLPPNAEIFVICRTGNRSDLACQQLAAQGFTNVHNVVPGMSAWSGSTEGGATV